MYRPNFTVNVDPINYINGTDIYNSLFIHNLQKQPINKKIVKSSKLSRVDLLSSFLYGSSSNSGIVGLTNAYDYTNFDDSNTEVKYVTSDSIRLVISET